MSRNSKFGKKLPINGKASSGTYRLLMPRTKSVGPSYEASHGLEKGKVPKALRLDARISIGTRNLNVCDSGDQKRLVSKNCLIGND